jgi:hypothetical protein
VRYAVEVEGAGNSVLVTSGSITFEPSGDGTRVRWSEAGDLGGNPLMGYWALAMGRLQGTEMGKGLDRLSILAASPSDAEPVGGAPQGQSPEQEAPTDSGSVGAS